MFFYITIIFHRGKLAIVNFILIEYVAVKAYIFVIEFIEDFT